MDFLHLIGAQDVHAVVVITGSVLFAKAVEYVGVKIFKIIDLQFHTPLDESWWTKK